MPNPIVAAIGAVGTLGSSVISSNAQSKASSSAAAAQSEASALSVEEQRRQFDALNELMSPYVQSGYEALNAQQNMLGLNGEYEQQKAIDAIQYGPLYESLAQTGEDAILQNASATGGLRGGNVQGALAQYRPALLQSLINQQFSNLGGLTTLGQNSAAGVGGAGMTMASNIGELNTQAGAAKAGNYLAQGQIASNLINTPMQLFGAAAGLGYF